MDINLLGGINIRDNILSQCKRPKPIREDTEPKHGDEITIVVEDDKVYIKKTQSNKN